MQRFITFSRVNLLGIFLLGSGLTSLSAAYFAGRAPSGHSHFAPALLLEDRWKAGQGIFGLLPGPEAPTADSIALDTLIAWRAHPELWSFAQQNDLSHFILRKSRQYDVEPMLLLSLIDVESRYRPSAVSPKGAVGLMQLMPGTAEEVAQRGGLEWSPSMLEDPKANIELGLRYVVKLRAEFRKPEEWLTAYNIGPNALKKKLESGETPPSGYVERVKSTVQLYRNKARRNRARPGLYTGGQWL